MNEPKPQTPLTDAEIDIKHELSDGKYTYIFYKQGGQKCLRYGEEWRDLTGDNLTYCLAAELQETKIKLQETKLWIEKSNTAQYAQELEYKLQEAEARVKDLESNNRYQRGYDAGEKSMAVKLQETERQRDEAKMLLAEAQQWIDSEPDWKDKYHTNLKLVIDERDQLIEVVDELARHINSTTLSNSEIFALRAYVLLPHVQAKKGNKQ